MSATTPSSPVQRARSTARRTARALVRRGRRWWRKGIAHAKLLVAKVRRQGPVPAAEPGPQLLTPTEALAENGFYVFRNLFDAEESRRLADRLKSEFGIVDEQQRTSIDATVRFELARELLFDPRILDAARRGLGRAARFLQVADVQYNHDHTGWHRDSPYRGEDCSASPDWADTSSPYRVAKLIIYFESDNAGMGMLAGSHVDPIEMDATGTRAKERAGKYTVIARDDEPNRRFTAEEKSRPMAWAAQVGDALLFDERMYHCGRRVEGDTVISDRDGKKTTLSYVFGDDNAHSARMYSYFRFARTDLSYAPLPDDLVRKLDEYGLSPSVGWGNHFEREPEELRGAFLRDPSKMDVLIDRFSKVTSPS